MTNQQATPWYIHHQSNKLMLNKRDTQAYIECEGAESAFLKLQMQYGIVPNRIQTDGSRNVFSKFFNMLPEKSQNNLILSQEFNIANFLEHDQGQLKKRLHHLKLLQKKNLILDQLEGSSNKKIVLVHLESLSDNEVHEGVWGYINKHGRDICAFATTEKEVKLLAEKSPYPRISLTIIDHWTRDRTFFSLWVGDAFQIGSSIADMIHDIPKIDALRLIACHAGEPNIDFIKQHPPCRIKNGHSLIRRTLFFSSLPEDKETPFKPTSLAAIIWKQLLTRKPDREFSLFASPAYVTFFNTQFVGSLHDDESKTPNFDGMEEGDSSCSKAICVSTRGVAHF